MRTILRFAMWIALLATATTTTARAQTDAPTAASDDAEARLRFEAGRSAYARGRFEDALADFQRAYELSARYELLYNVGQAYDHLRRDDEAIEAFRRYLADAPADAPNRAEVERRIEVIREAQARAQAEEAPRPTPPPPTAAPDPAPWIVLGVGAAVFVGGAVLLGVGISDGATVESATAPTRWAEISAAYERAPILEGVGIAALVVGAVGAGVGLVWALSGGGSATAERARLRLGPGSMSIEGTF